MLNPSIQGTDKQDKSQLIQRSDTLIIFPYIKSTKNHPTICVGLILSTYTPFADPLTHHLLYKQKTPLLGGADVMKRVEIISTVPSSWFA